MKLSAMLVMAALSISYVHAEPVVTTPSGRLTPNLAIPIKIELPKGNQNNFDISIASGGVSLIQVSTSGDVTVRAIATRFQATSSNVRVGLATLGETIYQTDRFLDISEFPTIPEDRDRATYMIGKTTYNLTRGGKEVELRNSPGKFIFFVKNAASKKHYVNEVEIELTKADLRSTVKVKGSPYWYEPLMILEGDFDAGAILRVVSD